MRLQIGFQADGSYHHNPDDFGEIQGGRQAGLVFPRTRDRLLIVWLGHAHLVLLLNLRPGPWVSMTRTSIVVQQPIHDSADLPVIEHQFDNGLRVLIWERPESPIVYSDLFFSVGSVNDPPHLTGMAHFLEHMLFKGTKRFPKGAIDRLTFLAGGQANAETDEDATHYWFALPSQSLELALALESDRLQHPRFEAEEVDSERRVIAEESRRELDQPWARLERAHLAASFPGHAYRNPVLGWPEDLEQIGPADLRRFHRKHYVPGGATLVVIGAIEPAKLLDRVCVHFGSIPGGRPPELPGLPVSVGPVPAGRVELYEADSVSRGLFGWRTCPRAHPDSAALEVLSEILGSGRDSRLSRRLVHRQQCATSADASHEPSLQDGIFYVGIEGESRADPQKIEAAIFAELAELAHRGPSRLEMERVRSRLTASWFWELDDLGAAASGLGHASLTGGWRLWPEEYHAAIRVEPSDIRRVVRKYLNPEALVAGWLLPRSARGQILVPAESGSNLDSSDKPVRAVESLPGKFPAIAEGWIGAPTSSHAGSLPARQVMPNGMRLIGEPRPGCGVLAIEFYCDAGILREARPGVAFLTARMREEGTRGRSASAIARVVEQCGGSLEVLPAGISLRIGAAHLETALGLLADLVRRPSFPAQAFDWTRRRLKAELTADFEDPAYRAGLEFLRQIYGQHPYGRDPRGTRSGLEKLTLKEVRSHQARWFSPERSFLVVTGDFSWPELNLAWNDRFGDWPASGQPLEPPRQPRSGRPAKNIQLPFNGTQSHVIMGHLGVERRHLDYPALAVVDHILGSGPGLTDRLNRLLRDEMGLVYSVQGGMTESADVVPGMFRIALASHPAEVGRAIAAVEQELFAVHAGAFSDREFEEARRYLAASWVFDFQGVSQRAERWLELERWGLPLSDAYAWPEQLASLTPEMVRQAARTHLRPAQMVRVVCGPSPAVG